ncbi:MAG: hypothetical protein BWY70_00357 [Bacteroidetes bacterium ADurb.Bin408]|nr:MAG: hypothetical protein BWY70_00357 [Bacteroidetes bacterium ADurb.Bin408]
MGKGDKKTRRGKIFMGSYGVSRPQRSKKSIIKAAPAKAEIKEKAKIKVVAEPVVEEPVKAVDEQLEVIAIEKAEKLKKTAPKKETTAKSETKKTKTSAEDKAKEVKPEKPEKEKKPAKKAAKKE